MATLNALRVMTLGDFEPDLVLYLDVEPSVGLARARGRGELDRIEMSGLAFFENARKTYKNLVSLSEKAIEIDAMQAMDAVHNDVEKALTTWYEKRVNAEPVKIQAGAS